MFISTKSENGKKKNKKKICKKTRPDTRLPKLRVGGQGLNLRSLDHLNKNSEVKEIRS